MRTLILSDTHLGNGGPYDIFAGDGALPQMLDALGPEPLRVFFNGDVADFLDNDDPLHLDPSVAVVQARAIAAHPGSAAVFAALGRGLARGGEVILRLGNHDVEMALPEVQEVFREALGQPEEIAARLQFQRGEEPFILSVGELRVLLTHGEHTDTWNRVDYARLPGASISEDEDARFTYAPGSHLVKELLHPLKVEYGLGFIDLLKPDFQGAVLAALGVKPLAVKELFKRQSLSILWHLFRRAEDPHSFKIALEDMDLRLAERLLEHGLTSDEADAFAVLLSDGPLSFADAEQVLSARNRALRAGLLLYAKLHRLAAGKKGDAFFALEPESEEWAEAQRLAAKYGAQVVLFGHTHAARWRAEPGLLYVNTGTWIWLMRTPPADASSEVWSEFLASLSAHPEGGSGVERMAHFTAALLSPEGDGATVALVHWEPGEGLSTLQSGAIGVAGASAARP